MRKDEIRTSMNPQNSLCVWSAPAECNSDGALGSACGGRSAPSQSGGRDAFHRVRFWLFSPEVPPPPVGTRSTASDSGSCLPRSHHEQSGTEWNPSLPTPRVGTRSTASDSGSCLSMGHHEKSGTEWNPSLPPPPVGTRSTASDSGSFLPMGHNEKSGTEWNPSLPTPPVGTRSTASDSGSCLPDVPQRAEWDGVESVPTNPTGRDAFHRVRFWLLSPDVPQRAEWDGVESVPTNSFARSAGI
jgi:hypothetical protein